MLNARGEGGERQRCWKSQGDRLGGRLDYARRTWSLDLARAFESGVVARALFVIPGLVAVILLDRLAAIVRRGLGGLSVLAEHTLAGQEAPD